VKIIRPTRLLAEAAEVLQPVLHDIVVIGAAALEVALADASTIAITPTRDIDLVVATSHAANVVRHLEAADLSRSDVPHERAFTWIRGDLKVQLVRTFHPFPKPPADRLPVNNVFGMTANALHRIDVAFAENPAALRLRCANTACLLALKQAAFGRTRPPDATPVERDFHDAYLLISAAADTIVAELALADHEVRERSADAISRLGAGGAATSAAARQMLRLRAAATQREAEAAVRRAAISIQQRLDRAG
jgi:hypothetical protein